jgi:hypothetical protein
LARISKNTHTKKSTLILMSYGEKNCVLLTSQSLKLDLIGVSYLNETNQIKLQPSLKLFKIQLVVKQLSEDEK